MGETKSCENKMSEIKVIGAGFGRTGTMTLKVALEQLGFDPCYHMKEVIFKGKFDDWICLEEGDKTSAEQEKLVKRALDGYAASVDFPSSMYYREQMSLYPDAKVLLSVRDTPATWVKSVKATNFRGEDEWIESLDPNAVVHGTVGLGAVYHAFAAAA